MTPSQLARMTRIVELEMQSPGSGAEDFGILSGTQEAESRTIIAAEPAAEPAKTSQTGPGRPRLIDQEKRDKILAMLENGFSQPICAAHVGVSLRTLRRAMARDAEFRERALRAETLFEQWPLMTIIRAARTSWRAASWLIANTPHVSVRKRKREEKLKELQPPAADPKIDPIIAKLAQPCTASVGRGK